MVIFVYYCTPLAFRILKILHCDKLFSIYTMYPNSSHNTDLISFQIYISSIVLPRGAKLKELNLRIAPSAGAIFSCIDPAPLGIYGPVYYSKHRKNRKTVP